jgi:hypothetical protein
LFQKYFAAIFLSVPFQLSSSLYVNKLYGWSVVGVILVAAVNMYFQEYDGGDDIVQCPYDKFHRCLRHRMTKHMWKCHRREYERDRNIRYFELKHKIEQQRSQQLRPVQQLPQQPQQLPQQPQQLPQQPHQPPQQSQQPQQIQGEGLQPPHQEQQQQQQEEFQQVLQQLQQLLPQEEEESWDNLNYATYIPPCKCRFVNKLL